MTNRSLCWIRFLCLTVALFLAATSLAAGDPPSDPVSPPTLADQHIAQAKQLFQAQKYSEAGDHLMAAHQERPQPVLLFNAGQAYRKALRPVEARNAYQKLIETYPDHALVPESKGYVQTLDALIAQVKEKQQIELALTEQNAKTEKELAEERARREEVQKELSKYKKPFYKTAWFWLLISGAAVGGGIIAAGVLIDRARTKTAGDTHEISFSLTF